MNWKWLLYPFALIYGVITSVRNGFYRIGFFKPSKFSLPIISIGNLSMGGTGKTPHTEYLIRLLVNQYKIATLSRGFGRKQHGFILAGEKASAIQIGDEPYQYYRKFGREIAVAVDANRVNGVMEICRYLPETEVILLDDAYQHRAIHAGLSILLTPFDDPFYADHIVPVGRLREARWGKNRADLIIVTNTPKITENEKREIIAKINPQANQSIFFSRVNYHVVKALNGDKQIDKLEGAELILVTGIAKSEALKTFLQKKNRILEHFECADHYNFKQSDIHRIHNLFDKFAKKEIVIITTEKDAMRLLNEEFYDALTDYPWYYQEISVEIDHSAAFNERVQSYVEKNC